MKHFVTHEILHNGKLVDVADCPIIALKMLAEQSNCDFVIEAISKGWQIIRKQRD